MIPPKIIFWLLSGTVAVLLFHGVARPKRMYEYPYFMAAVFAVFILPQALSLTLYPGAAREKWVTAVMIMSFLCLASCWVGYKFRPLRMVLRWQHINLNQKRLFHGALFFLIIAWYFNWKIRGMTSTETGGLWTGKVTIYHFFIDLVYPALAISLMAALHRSSFAAWFAVALSALLPLQAAVFYGRREGAIQLLLTIGLVLYFQRQLKPSRLVLVTLIVGATLFIPATGKYRAMAGQQDWDSIKSFNWVENFRNFIQKRSSVLELRNAALIIEATSEANLYEYGAGYWNELVFRFVPAQVVGSDFKKSLNISSTENILQKELYARGYRIPVGTTQTGIGDSFNQLGWLGFMFFWALGIIFRSLWLAAHSKNGILAQLLYILTATSAMRAVTHQTVDYLPGLTYYVIFLGLLVLYARDKPRKRSVLHQDQVNPLPPSLTEHETRRSL